MGPRVRLLVLWTALLPVIGCSGGSSNNGTGNLRIFQASPDAPQSKVIVDSSSTQPTIDYGNDTGYLSIKSGSRRIQLVPASGSSSIFDQAVSISKDGNETLLLTGAVASLQPVMLIDGGTTAKGNAGYVRVVNASQSMGPADTYIIPAGTGIAGVQPVTAALAFDKDTGYQLTAAGTYEVLLTAPGTKNVFVDTGPINLDSGKNHTVIALDRTSGGFIYAQLIDQ